MAVLATSLILSTVTADAGGERFLRSKADIRQVILSVGINPSILIHAVDRAHLLGLRLDLLTLPIGLSTSVYQNDRKADSERRLGLANLSVPVGRLRGNANLRSIISTRKGYKDINQHPETRKIPLPAGRPRVSGLFDLAHPIV